MQEVVLLQQEYITSILHEIPYLWDPPHMIGILYIPAGGHIIKIKDLLTCALKVHINKPF